MRGDLCRCLLAYGITFCKAWCEQFSVGASIFKSMSEVTRILAAVQQGDAHAADELLPLVYDELRKLAAARMAAEEPGQTLQPTALVHEAYLRLVDVEKADRWDSRGHFFAAAAEAMRRILVDRARARGCEKRGGQFQRLDIDAIDLVTTCRPGPGPLDRRSTRQSGRRRPICSSAGRASVLCWYVDRRVRRGNRNLDGKCVSPVGFRPRLASQ